MNLSNYIPTGRTSLVKKGESALQIQTEYAYRPYPRLTTTISNNGQVIHKIEKKLEKAVDSFEEQSQMDDVIKRQHLEVLDIVKDDSFQHNYTNNNETSSSRSTLEKAVNNVAVVSTPKSADNDLKSLTLSEKINTIPGVQAVYQLDIEGNFYNKISGDQFKKKYSVIFKNLKDLLDIFTMIPGITITREKGVYEVDRDKLYMVSAGDELFFVTIEDARLDINYEKAIKEFVDSIF